MVRAPAVQDALYNGLAGATGTPIVEVPEFANPSVAPLAQRVLVEASAGTAAAKVTTNANEHSFFMVPPGTALAGVYLALMLRLKRPKKRARTCIVHTRNPTSEQSLVNRTPDRQSSPVFFG
jgi:hypothetical protein